MGWLSRHHTDLPWCIAGWVTILYHSTIDVGNTVTYDEKTVFGSHGLYAVWSGTSPRNVTTNADMVASNELECLFNMAQIAIAYDWTQDSPPGCRFFLGPPGMLHLYSMMVRIETFGTNIAEGTHLSGLFIPIQISLSLTLKECKAI
jgi:hypothetical protein